MSDSKIEFLHIDHHSVYCSDLEKSKHFFNEILGMEIDPNRPAALKFNGAWFKVGDSGQTIHCLCLPNPDPVDGRPKHGGLDKHVAIRITNLAPLIERLEAHNIFYTKSKSGRGAIFFRDPDANAIEMIEASQAF